MSVTDTKALTVQDFAKRGKKQAAFIHRYYPILLDFALDRMSYRELAEKHGLSQSRVWGVVNHDWSRELINSVRADAEDRLLGRMLGLQEKWVEKLDDIVQSGKNDSDKVAAARVLFEKLERFRSRLSPVAASQINIENQQNVTVYDLKGLTSDSLTEIVRKAKESRKSVRIIDTSEVTSGSQRTVEPPGEQVQS